MGDAPVLEFPDVCAQGGPLLLSVVEIAVVAGDPLLGGVDGEPGVRFSFSLVFIAQVFRFGITCAFMLQI